MSGGDRTPEERLAGIEALVQARHDQTVDWRKTATKRFDKVDNKLDRLLDNNKNVITLPVLTEAMRAHVETCPSRNSLSNPGPKEKDINGKLNGTVDMMLKGYRGLGVVGSLLVLLGVAMVVIIKLAGVF